MIYDIFIIKRSLQYRYNFILCKYITYIIQIYRFCVYV
nr:MAG TPA: hypothetical protein [Bacteriophage sp.]